MIIQWPKDNEQALIDYYGAPTAAVESQLVDIVPPFRMTYAGKPITTIRFHRKCAPALREALDRIWTAYGRDQTAIDRDRVSIYDGAYNPRKISGSDRWSNHAFAAAIDIDAAHNGFNTGHGTMPERVVRAFKAVGARWGGDYKGRTDPMHFEFCGGGTFETDGVVTIPPPATGRPVLIKGDSGPDVVYLQASIGIPADGYFGTVTDAAAHAFQAAAGLASDGVVGSATWSAVDDLVRRMAAGTDGLTPEQKTAITAAAGASSIQSYDWDDHGHSPPGYIAGMGECFAMALGRLAAGDAGAMEMSRAAGNADTDALALYADEFSEHGMSNDVAGPQTLRHLFVLMIGLGMRESSGRWCEGRDMSATNMSADTCEAALFQTSWDIKTASPHIPPLLASFWDNPQGFRTTFAELVEPTASEIECYGAGDGAKYQWLSKFCPAFTAMVTAIGLRKRRSHWGPIGRMEVEIVPDADLFLQQVERVMGAPAITPPPVVLPPEAAMVSINIEVKGDVRIFVNGKLITL